MSTALLLDAKLIENGILLDSQVEANNKFQKIKPSYETEVKKVNELKEKLSRLQKKFTKSNKKQKAKAGKKLQDCKQKVKAAKKKFESCKIVKEFNGARESLIRVPGIYMSQLKTSFENMKLSWSKIKGGSFEGNECYKLLRSLKEISSNLLKPKVHYKGTKSISVGNSCTRSLFDEWTRLRVAEFSFTCRIRSLCLHEIIRIENLQGAAMRLESALFATKVPYMSSHYRVHILQRIKRYGDILARDSTTELLNQVNLRLERKTEKFYQFTEKVNEQFRSQLTALSTIDPPKLRGKGDVVRKSGPEAVIDEV